MIRRLLCSAAAGLAVLSLVGAHVTAFGDSGHRVIGTLAELHLRDSMALGEIRKILRPNETLADASVWHDRIKNALYEDADTSLFRLNHPAHDTYHYANLPFQSAGYGLDVPGARSTDLIQVTREAIRVLRTGQGPFAKREAVRLIAHLVGDMHQPLHVGNAFVNESGPLAFVVPKGPTGWRPTLGGNALVYGPEHRFNLHSYWDSHAVNLAMNKEDVPTYAARLLKELEPTAAWRGRGPVDSWPAQWASEGINHAKEVHRGITLVSYLGPDDAKRTAHRWLIEQPAGYDERARPFVRQQLAMAGYRLASVLRAIWPD